MNETSTAIKKILEPLSPLHVEVINESINHSGYFEGKESHFKLTIVSDVFVDQRLLKRHRQVYALVTNLMIAQGGTIHALALHTYTAQEWQHIQNIPDSPQCAGQNVP